MDAKKELNEITENYSSIISDFLKYFTIIIIVFIILSHLANKYIPGLGMHFIYTFLPIGASYHWKPVLTNFFHKPISINNTNNQFYKTENMSSLNQNETKTYYELLQLGGTFSSILFGYHPPSFQKIYIQDYNTLYWYQKIIMTIFGAIQIAIGSTTTALSSLAFLFGGKDGFFLNTPQTIEKDLKYKNLTQTPAISVTDRKNNKIVLQSGWTKLALFFNYIFFLPVDKLTYGTQFFLENRSSTIWERTKYFFYLVFIGGLFTGIYFSFGINTWNIILSIIIIIILFITFSTRILNPTYSPDPLCNWDSLIENIKLINKNPNLTLNDINKQMINLQKEIIDSVAAYKEKALKVAQQEGLVENLSGGKIKVKEKYRKNIEKIKSEME